MPWTYCLQILQGHISNVRHLICVLNISRDLESFISSGTKLHIIGPILLMVSKPKCVVFAFGISKFIFFVQCVLSLSSTSIETLDLVLQVTSFTVNNSLMKGGDRLMKGGDSIYQLSAIQI